MEEIRDKSGMGTEEKNLGTRSGRLEETRRGVEKMAVEEQGSGTGTQNPELTTRTEEFVLIV